MSWLTAALIMPQSLVNFLWKFLSVSFLVYHLTDHWSPYIQTCFLCQWNQGVLYQPLVGLYRIFFACFVHAEAPVLADISCFIVYHIIHAFPPLPYLSTVSSRIFCWLKNRHYLLAFTLPRSKYEFWVSSSSVYHHHRTVVIWIHT